MFNVVRVCAAPQCIRRNHVACLQPTCYCGHERSAICTANTRSSVAVSIWDDHRPCMHWEVRREEAMPVCAPSTWFGQGLKPSRSCSAAHIRQRGRRPHQAACRVRPGACRLRHRRHVSVGSLFANEALTAVCWLGRSRSAFLAQAWLYVHHAGAVSRDDEERVQ